MYICIYIYIIDGLIDYKIRFKVNTQ